MSMWIEITDPEGVGNMAYGAKKEYPHFAALALIATSRAIQCTPPKPVEEIIIPVPPPKEVAAPPRLSERDKEIKLLLNADNYNKMRSALSKYSDRSTAGMNKPAIRAALKALLG